MRRLFVALVVAAIFGSPGVAYAQFYPAPMEGDWVAQDFHFHTGEVIPDFRIHYTTVGGQSGEPVLVG